eukprot:sb/3478156/
MEIAVWRNLNRMDPSSQSSCSLVVPSLATMTMQPPVPTFRLEVDSSYLGSGNSSGSDYESKNTPTATSGKVRRRSRANSFTKTDRAAFLCGSNDMVQMTMTNY